MTLTSHQLAALSIICGIYLVVAGLTSKALISESDIPATAEERVQAKATPMKRTVAVIIGLGGCLYGIYLLLR